MNVQPAETVDAFVAQVRRALGEPPALEAPSAPSYNGETRLGAVTLKEFRYRDSLGDMVTLSVAEPPTRRWARPVIAVHQTNRCGRREVFGQGGNPFLAYGLRLAERGHRVFAIDLAWTGERQPHDPWNYGMFYRQYPDWTVAGRDVADLTGLTTVIRRDFGETEPVACLGHSQAGLVILFFAAATGLVARWVVNAGFFSRARRDPDVAHPLYASRFLVERADRLRVSDHMDLLASAAARVGEGLLIVYSRDSTIVDSVPSAEEMHRLGRFSAGVRVACVELEHLYPATVQTFSFAFLESGQADWPLTQINVLPRADVLAEGMDEIEYLFRERAALLLQKEQQRSAAEDSYTRLLQEHNALLCRGERPVAE